MHRLNPVHWQWPLPAVLAWALCWAVFRELLGQGMALQWALGLSSALGVACSLWGATWWRRLLIAAGFPLSLAARPVSIGGGLVAGVGLVAAFGPLALGLSGERLARCTAVSHPAQCAG